MRKKILVLLFCLSISWSAIVDITTQGNAISSGDYTSGHTLDYAFNNINYNGDAFADGWWSAQTGSGVNGVAYIGQSGLMTKVTRIRYQNSGLIS